MHREGIYLTGKKKKRRQPILLPWLVLPGIVILAVVLYQLPPVQRRLSWRLDIAMTYLRRVINPVSAMPTASAILVAETLPTTAVTSTLASPTPGAAGSAALSTTPLEPTAIPITPTPPPGRVFLEPPAIEKQDWNNCGPATLSMYLHFYGWDGDQYTISEQVKPLREDRNVNVDEMVNFVLGNVGWLDTGYRVGGSIDLLRRFIAAGIPIMIEESFILREEQNYWPDDDNWTGHYLLLTGYDDQAQVFFVQNSYANPAKIEPVVPNQVKTYQEIDSNWQAFNRVFIMIYRPEQEQTVKDLLGSDWNPDTNRENALSTAQAEAEADSQNSFAWFNVGSNLVYFENYEGAVQAYDNARNLGLPQRMLRYQFGTFLAYFHSGRIEDLLALTSYALDITPNSEEAHLWHGWGLYRQGDTAGAIQHFNQALDARPGYTDAIYALNYALEN